MRPIDLDFVRQRRAWPVWLVLAVAVLIATEVGVGYMQLKGELLDSGRAVDPVHTPAARQEPMSPEMQREHSAAQRVLEELTLPWETLFHSVEVATGKEVALLSIEPDAGRELVRITGEASNYPAAIRFMVRLQEAKALTGVHLISHEIREEDPERPYSFALAGSWRMLR